MADHSDIEWTNATWNIITGCSIESPGCKNCYAMKLAGTRLRNHPSRVGLTYESAAGPVWTDDVRFNVDWLRQPLEWTRPRLIFVVAHGDLFHPLVPDAWLDEVFAVMTLAGRHTHQVLTKRTARAADYLRALHTPAGLRRLQAAIQAVGTASEIAEMQPLTLPLRNVWVGTSVEDQHYADVRREPMREIAAAGWLPWVSYEPALGPVDWTGWEFLRWIVSGGESGKNARPSQAAWHRGARDFCRANGIDYLFKQWGEWLGELQDGARDRETIEINASDIPIRVGKKASGRTLDGVIHNSFPAALALAPAPRLERSRGER